MRSHVFHHCSLLSSWVLRVQWKKTPEKDQASSPGSLRTEPRRLSSPLRICVFSCVDVRINIIKQKILTNITCITSKILVNRCNFECLTSEFEVNFEWINAILRCTMSEFECFFEWIGAISRCITSILNLFF